MALGRPVVHFGGFWLGTKSEEQRKFEPVNSLWHRKLDLIHQAGIAEALAEPQEKYYFLPPNSSPGLILFYLYLALELAMGFYSALFSSSPSGRQSGFGCWFYTEFLVYSGISARNGVPLSLLAAWPMAKLGQFSKDVEVFPQRSTWMGVGGRVPHKQEWALPVGFWARTSFIMLAEATWKRLRDFLLRLAGPAF